MQIIWINGIFYFICSMYGRKSYYKFKYVYRKIKIVYNKKQNKCNIIHKLLLLNEYNKKNYKVYIIGIHKDN